MIRDPNTVPIPAPDPATPTVAAPAPMNLAAVSISRLQTETDKGLNKHFKIRKSRSKYDAEKNTSWE